MNILITGATGFLGRHICQESERQHHQVMCLKHAEIGNSAHLVREFAPDVLVHCAWGGVSAADRNNPQLQKANVEMSEEVFNLYPYRQIIALGSQDEYGVIDGIVGEGHPLSPVSEYAKAKIQLCHYLQQIASTRPLEWQWLRIFNMYGRHQQANWLIPSIVKKCLDGEHAMDTTLGEQQYAYLYAEDFARAVTSIFGSTGKSGIYNISSSTPLPLRDIFLLIRQLTNANIEFSFGAIPYRDNQSMMICGNSEKFAKAFGTFETTPFEKGLSIIINDYKQQQQ